MWNFAVTKDKEQATNLVTYAVKGNEKKFDALAKKLYKHLPKEKQVGK